MEMRQARAALRKFLCQLPGGLAGNTLRIPGQMFAGERGGRRIPQTFRRVRGHQDQIVMLLQSQQHGLHQNTDSATQTQRGFQADRHFFEAAMIAHLELIRRITSGDCKATLVSSCKKKAIFQRVVWMKLAFLTVDRRQDRGDYAAPAPDFASAPEALMRGFAALPELEVHVISCAQKPLKSPDKLADNIWLHSVYVPKPGWTRTSYQGCSRAVRRKLKTIRPDLVHGHGT